MQMIVFAIVAAVVTTLGLHQCVNAQGCHKKTWSDPSTVNRILTPLPHETAMTVPDALDWRNINGTNWCTSSRNQHIPQYCGSCWAMASTSALSDRIRIARHAAFPDFMIAPQTLVHCTCDGCHGGNAEIAYLWIYLNGIGTEPCQNYIAQGIGRECTAEAKCMNCSPDGNCSAVTQYPKFYLKEFGQVLGVEHMKAEIAARGPIACYVNAGPIYMWGFANAGPDLPVFTSLEGRNSTDHVISVVGYGYDSKQGIPYWVIRNSWGEYWGDNGYFRLESGKNLLNMEHTACAWAVPKIPNNV